MLNTNLYQVLGRCERVPQDVQIATTILSAVLVDSRVYNTEEVCTEYGWSLPFVQQIIRKLRIAGLLYTKKGPKGGFYRKTT